jgi:hypothetical protein
MLKQIADVPGGIVALTAVGTITRDDYAQTIEPILDDARRDGRRLRILLEIGPEYDHSTVGAAWEKTENALRSRPLLGLVEGYAIVTDRRWVRELMHLTALVLPFPMRVFDIGERDDAVAWLSALP